MLIEALVTALLLVGGGGGYTYPGRGMGCRAAEELLANKGPRWDAEAAGAYVGAAKKGKGA
jgi:hypothetical protein